MISYPKFTATKTDDITVDMAINQLAKLKRHKYIIHFQIRDDSEYKTRRSHFAALDKVVSPLIADTKPSTGEGEGKKEITFGEDTNPYGSDSSIKDLQKACTTGKPEKDKPVCHKTLDTWKQSI